MVHASPLRVVALALLLPGCFIPDEASDAPPRSDARHAPAWLTSFAAYVVWVALAACVSFWSSSKRWPGAGSPLCVVSVPSKAPVVGAGSPTW